MKRLLFLALVCASTAYSETVGWLADSNAGFHLQVSSPATWNGFDETLTSPSGLWEIRASANSTQSSLPDHIDFYARASAVFVPYIPTTNFPGDTVDFADASSTMVVPGIGGGFCASDGYIPGWEGYYTYQFDIPDPLNVCSWSWSFDIVASGPELTVPEPAVNYLVLFGLGGLLWRHRIRYRKL